MSIGHVQDMNNRLEQNRALRPSLRPKFKENNREGIFSKSNSQIEFKSISEEQLIEIKLKINQEIKAEDKKARLIFGFSIIVGLAILWVVWKSLT